MRQLLALSHLHSTFNMEFSILPLQLLLLHLLPKALFNHVDSTGQTCLPQQSLLPTTGYSVSLLPWVIFTACEDWANARWAYYLWLQDLTLPFSLFTALSRSMMCYSIMNSFWDGFESDILTVDIVSGPSNVSLLPYQLDLYFIQHSNVPSHSGLILNISKSELSQLRFHYIQGWLRDTILPSMRDIFEKCFVSPQKAQCSKRKLRDTEPFTSCLKYH